MQLTTTQQDNYELLLVSIEAGADILNILLAQCADNDVRDFVIAKYESELEADIRRFRIELDGANESMRHTIDCLVQQEPYLQQKGKAVITVMGSDKLCGYRRPGEERSEQEIFFGFLQWTREGLREHPTAIVLWVTPEMRSSIFRKAPDFHSWCRGVFRF
jgi:hypothetical protein